MSIAVARKGFNPDHQRTKPVGRPAKVQTATTTTTTTTTSITTKKKGNHSTTTHVLVVWKNYQSLISRRVYRYSNGRFDLDMAIVR
mmetsp:Transcript_9196/g.9854  ORF Transcript_9196/g.9854 Transcript_9196/m.9854 type:complete len:86 (-) Transcript_9196:814-1071(-)